MDINRAKEQIKNAVSAYLAKDPMTGEYEIPVERQRPVFLVGPPGIGKTAIMEQIAGEMGIGLLAYSMTHHTRQSALGLPFIVHKKYGDMEFDVSEYTMSDIIASIYEMEETSGVKNGILFLDEINCVSETLSPVMLQFLQYKVFGKHRVPDGWVIVTAGNPPEYNNSVHEFDIVTLDRLKKIEVEPDYETWKKYAYKIGMHPAILSYLEIKKTNFYKVESTVEGKRFVTARSWDDLSRMITVYEKMNLTVDRDLIEQYLQDRDIAKDFSSYYDLFNKYKTDYKIPEIAAGNYDASMEARAKRAPFDEKLAVVGLLLDYVFGEAKEIMDTQSMLESLIPKLREIRSNIGKGIEPLEAFKGESNAILTELEKGKRTSSISRDEIHLQNMILNFMDQEMHIIRNADAAFDINDMIAHNFNENVDILKGKVNDAHEHLANIFHYLDKVYPEGQEVLIFVTELTANEYTSRFIAAYGCDEYYDHNKELLFYDRQKEIAEKIEKLEL